MKKLFLRTFVIAGVLGTSAFAFTCKENYCDDYRVGLGAFYSNYNNDNLSSSDTGGYFSFTFSRHYKRLFADGELKLGVSSAKVKGNILGKDISSTSINSFITDQIRLGVNLGSFRNPFFIAASIAAERHDFAWNNDAQRSNLGMFFTGASISGRYMVAQNVGLEYDLGYSYMPFGAFSSATPSSFLRIIGGHLYKASFGFIYHREEGESSAVDIYARITGKYYDINASRAGEAGEIGVAGTTTVQFPKSKDYSIMFEIGVGF